MCLLQLLFWENVHFRVQSQFALFSKRDLANGGKSNFIVVVFIDLKLRCCYYNSCLTIITGVGLNGGSGRHCTNIRFIFPLESEPGYVFLRFLRLNMVCNAMEHGNFYFSWCALATLRVCLYIIWKPLSIAFFFEKYVFTDCNWHWKLENLYRIEFLLCGQN